MSLQPEQFCSFLINLTTPVPAAVVVIGSVGFIRQVAISLSKAATENGVNFDNYFILAVPATLWPLPSYKASDMIKLRQDYVFTKDDAIAKAAFKVCVFLYLL